MRLPYRLSIAASTASRSSAAMACKDTVVGQSIRQTFSAISSIVMGTSGTHKAILDGSIKPALWTGVGRKTAPAALVAEC
jgi:hypothetical protein